MTVAVALAMVMVECASDRENNGRSLALLADGVGHRVQVWVI